MFHVLVVEDDKNLRRLMEAVLKQNGYQPFVASDGEEALEVMDREHVDLMICDIMMPGMDGYELTRQLRSSGFTLPILMATARESFVDKQKGFLLGTDDYMVKPLDMQEMILRVGALLRRANAAASRKLKVGRVELNYDALSLSRASGEEQILPKKEFMLLFKLLSSPNQTFTRRQLLDEIWGMDSESDERTVDVHIKRLRQRLEEGDGIDLVTVRGLGYRAQVAG